MNLYNLLHEPLDRACAYYPDRTAVIEGERQLTYRELGEGSNRVSNALVGLGVGGGHVVGLLMPNCLEFISTQHGIWKSGAAAVQMPARASADDHIHFLLSAGASALLYHSDFDGEIERIRSECPNLQHLVRLAGDGSLPPEGVLDYTTLVSEQSFDAPEVETSPDDIAFISFTSGSTGRPKGVRNTHASWVHLLIPSGMEVGDIRPGEVFAIGAPLTHFAQIFVLPTLMRGGTVVVLPGLDVDLLFDAIERHRVTATALVPTVVYLMLAHPRRASVDLSSLRTVVYAGSPMAPARLKEAVDVFGPVFTQTYAGTEPGFMTILPKEDHVVTDDASLRRLSSAGRAMYHVTLSVQDDEDRILPPGRTGEICCRQAGSMVGYVDPTKDTEAIRDGWVHTGDIGYINEDGYVYIVDRKKDMVVTGGYNVFPRQVEDVLLQHPAVQQCAVIGVPDDKWGEAVKAVVVTGPQEVKPEELMALVKEKKGSVWAPKSVDFVDALPLNASGKIDKLSLKAPYWAGEVRLVH